MKQSVLMPDYLQNFVCSGSDCVFTCCSNWRVDIDEATVKKYRQCKEPAWQAKFHKDLIPASQDGMPARCRMDKNGYCTFLTEDRLCSIQKRFGAGYLSYTCRIFPRGYNNIKGSIEKWGSLGCPEIMKKVLFSGKKINFVEENLKKTTEPGAAVTYKLDESNEHAKSFYLLRKFAFDVLQNADYTMIERLLILAYFFNNFNEMREVEAVKLVALYEDIINSGEVREVIKDVKPERKFYFNLLRTVMASTASHTKDHVYKKYYKKMSAQLCLGVSDERWFFSLYDEYYRVFLQKNPLLMENYLISAAFTELFPLQLPVLWDSFMVLLIRYLVVNFFFMGLVVEEKGKVNQDKFLEGFAAIARVLDASRPTFTHTVLAEMKKSGSNDIIHAFHMIKI